MTFKFYKPTSTNTNSSILIHELIHRKIWR